MDAGLIFSCCEADGVVDPASASTGLWKRGRGPIKQLVSRVEAVCGWGLLAVLGSIS